jgi:methylated-DNA-[protein]-cysteine S-methyltransferase
MSIVTVSTPAGPFTIIAADTTVLAAGFTTDAEGLLSRVHPDHRGPAAANMDHIVKAVDAYFAGDLTAINAISTTQHTGGIFQAHAWSVMRDIPPGAPLTYRQFAALAGRAQAVRAAAAACARNAVALFVPCHRVVRSDGGLGGYRWGLDVKRFLIAHERQITKTGS